MLPLPPGFTLDSATGEIAGTVDGKSAPMFFFNVADSRGNSFLDAVTIPLAGLTITSPRVLPEATVNAPYRFRFEAVGNLQPVTWQMQDLDPPPEQLGFTFDRATGELAGAVCLCFQLGMKLLEHRLGIAQEGFHIGPYLVFQFVAADGLGLAAPRFRVDRGRMRAVAAIVELALPLGRTLATPT